jgi:hypothetical protein
MQSTLQNIFLRKLTSSYSAEKEESGFKNWNEQTG